jgi:hypothetical protein
MRKYLFVLFLILLTSGCVKTSVGEKMGVLTRLSHDGIFFHTWEAELIRGGMNNGNGSFGTQPFYFSIDNDSLITTAKEALEQQKEVNIKYHCEMFSSFLRGSQRCYLDAIEIKK